MLHLALGKKSLAVGRGLAPAVFSYPFLRQRAFQTLSAALHNFNAIFGGSKPPPYGLRINFTAKRFHFCRWEKRSFSLGDKRRKTVI
jgi:hypothetical protein